MSNSNGKQTLVKSMNGILSFDTGGGVVISGDTIVANTIDLTNLNIDNIQGIAPSDNITLYTNTTGNINLGGTTTALATVSGTNIASTASNDITNTATRDNTVKATRYAKLIGENQVFINTNSLSTGTITIDAGSTTNINNGTGKPVNIASLKLNAGTIFANGITDITVSPGTSGVLKIAGAQQIEGNNNANGFSICNNLTAGNFYLGNSTIGPKTTYTATNPYDIVNYQTAQSLVGGGSILGTNNIFTGTNEFQNNTIISGTTNSMTGNNSISGPTTINGINNSNTSINTGTNAGVVAIGNTSLLSTTILASTINIGNSGNNTINIGSPSGTTLNLRQPITPTYGYTTLPAGGSTTDSGTNVANTIGNVYSAATLAGGTVFNFSGAGNTRSANNIVATLTLPIGVYIVVVAKVLQCTATSNLSSIRTEILNCGCNEYVVNYSTGSITALPEELTVGCTGLFVSTSGNQIISCRITITASTGSWNLPTNSGSYYRAVRIA
jgi:hypothetical protein